MHDNHDRRKKELSSLLPIYVYMHQIEFIYDRKDVGVKRVCKNYLISYIVP